MATPLDFPRANQQHNDDDDSDNTTTLDNPSTTNIIGNRWAHELRNIIKSARLCCENLKRKQSRALK